MMYRKTDQSAAEAAPQFFKPVQTGVIVHDLDREAQPQPSERSSWFSKVWNYLVNWSYQPAEPQISHRRDRAGNVWWYVYNPSTGASTYLSSEDEVRLWLDQPASNHIGFPQKPWWS